MAGLEALRSKVAASRGLLLYFFDNGCMSCLSLRPKVEALINTKFPEMKLVWINSREYPELPAAYGVFASPAILLFFDGSEYKRFSKFVSISELDKAIEKYYSIIH
jgi:thioredoxin-like negative regulator of GroEL